MRRFSWLAVASGLASFGVVLASAADAQARADHPDAPEVRTAATVQRSVAPDLAIVMLQFSGEGSTPSRAGAHLAARADSLRRAFGTLGISRDSLVNRGSWAWWQGRIGTRIGPVRYVPRPTPGPDGQFREAVQDTTYVAHDAIEVRIHDLTKVGAVLDTALGRRITDIPPVRFSAGDVSAARVEALREATAQAREQAEAIAAAAGMQLGRVLSLSTQADDLDDYRPRGVFVSGASISMADVAPASGTVVVQPSIPVSVTVYGRWELVPKP